MIPRELIKKIRKIEIVTKRLVNDQLAGQYHSVFKGHGMHFDEVRQYQPGDDIRLIDWNVTARQNDVFVKQYVEERELTVMILVDMSGSEYFGSKGRLKSEIAAEISALLAFSAIKNNDRVGLILFTDQIEKFVPPKKGKKHVLRVIMEILSYVPSHKGTNISLALEYLSKIMRRKSVAFLISDFMDDGYEKPLAITYKRHDLVPIVLRDPIEEELPNVGLVFIEDPETGDIWPLDTKSFRVRENFREAAKQVRFNRETTFRRMKIDFINIAIHEPYTPALVNYFKIRAKRL